MPIPAAITDLSTTPGSNSPSGAEPPTEGDNHIRTAYAFIRQLYDAASASSTAAAASLAAFASVMASSAAVGEGDARVAVKRTSTGATATTQHVVNEQRKLLAKADFSLIGDGATNDSTAMSAAGTGTSKDFLEFSPGTYPHVGTTFSTARQHIRGRGWSSDASTTTARPGATLLKNANGTHLTLSGDDQGISDIAIDGLTASHSGDGVVITGTRAKLDNVSIFKQRGDALRLGGASSNTNLWMLLRPIIRDNTDDGLYIHHTGGSVTGDYPGGIPDVNAGVLIGGDFAGNGGVGIKAGTSIDNVLIGPASQNNTGKGLVLGQYAFGYKILGYYGEGNNGGSGNAGDELDIELGSVQHMVFGGRFQGSGGASGYRDVNAPGKNFILTYESGIGHFVHWGMLGVWNTQQDGSSTTVDFRAYLGSGQANVFNLKGSISGTSGGVVVLQTKTDGGAVADRLEVRANGDAVFKGQTTGTLFGGKTAFDTTTTGTAIEAGAGRIDIVNSGAGTKTCVALYDASGAAGSITTNGSGTTAYNTTSDRRLKQNVIDAPDQGNTIDAIRIVEYEFIKQPGFRYVGVLADELQRVVPTSVAGEPDAVTEEGEILPQGVDYSKLVPLLIKEIQSLRARVATLEMQP